MDVVFLGARLPLTKTYVYSDGRYATKPYPHVSRVTSFHEQFDSLEELATLLKKHASLNNCLFNGVLDRPLVAESRAGRTVKEPRQWVVFDFDKVEASDAEDVVSRYLPAECRNVSYVAQLSASMFRPDSDRWSGHIFMLVENFIDERTLKSWFEHLNFTVPALTQALTLSDSQLALHWPLDRTAANCARITYIAPPRCFGFTPDPVEHVYYVGKRNPKLLIPAFTPIDQIKIRDKINELRAAEGLDRIDYNTTPFREGEEVLTGVGEVEVHDIRTSGDHYIRFNLNGGDSFAYYIDLRSPDLVRNFKGEPFLKTEEVAPKLLEQLVKIKKRVLSKPPLEDDAEVMAFYATNRGAAVYTGVYRPSVSQLRLDQSKETPAYAWLSEHGIPLRTLPHMDLIFDPTKEISYIHGIPEINTFRPSRYMLAGKSMNKPSTLAEIPSTINKIMTSMMGDPTDEVKSHFMNWLSYIYQRRRKTGTAWVMHGVQGSGKSLFVKAVIAPIFGEEHVRTLQFGMLNKPYNGFLDGALFVVFEESDTRAVDNAEALDQKLKHWITDEIIEIEEKRISIYKAKTYFNCMFFSNNMSPILMPSDDRRYNVCERQHQRYYPTPNELATLTNGDELEAFADVLARWPIDEMAASRVIDSEARRDIHETTTSINQLIAEAVMRGDLDFFAERTPTDAEAQSDFHNRFNPLGMYRSLLNRFNKEAEVGETSVVTDEDLFVLYRTLITNTNYFQDSKTWRRRHYKSLGLDLKKTRMPGSKSEYVQALKVRWSPSKSVIPAPEFAGTVTMIPTKRSK